MTDTSKRNIIKIPNNISVLYCSKKKIAIFIGPLGRRSLNLNLKLNVCQTKKTVQVTAYAFSHPSKSKKTKIKALQGTVIALINQLLLEVSVLLCKKLKLIGVGYRAFLVEIFKNQLLYFRLGCSHFIYFKIPANLIISCFKATKIFIIGNYYQQITQIISTIRSYKLPEPYKGKGILHVNEKIVLKTGKKV